MATRTRMMISTLQSRLTLLARCPTHPSSFHSIAALSSSGSDTAPAAKPKRTLPKNRKRPPLPPLIDSDLSITYVRGSGPGGQVINKSSISCSLIHLPTGIRVQCHQTRSRETNRLLAKRILQGKLDQLWNPGTSQAEQKWARESKKKASRDRKRKRKVVAGSAGVQNDEGDEDDTEHDGSDDGEEDVDEDDADRDWKEGVESVSDVEDGADRGQQAGIS